MLILLKEPMIFLPAVGIVYSVVYMSSSPILAGTSALSTCFVGSGAFASAKKPNSPPQVAVVVYSKCILLSVERTANPDALYSASPLVPLPSDGSQVVLSPLVVRVR